MRIFTVCMTCQAELGHPSFEPFFAPYYDDRIAKIKCSRGHERYVMLQSQRFEVLLESGANALSEGFTLEAMATFSAALERFLEFAARVLLHHLGMHESTYAAMFTEMARQSERQIGCFLALHALVFETAFAPNKDIAPLRNAVIHKGKIPTPEEAENFCGMVYKEILRVLLPLERKCDQSIQAVIVDDIQTRMNSLPEGTQAVTHSPAGLLSLADAEHKATFDEAFTGYIDFTRKLREAEPLMHALHSSMFSRAPDA